LLFEDRLGVETSGRISSEDLGYTDERNTHYQPSRWRTLKRMLPKRTIGPDDVFLDLGSGMGRVVILAARYPFKRVLGVELSPELHEVAVRNLDAVRDRLVCRDVRLEQANALEYEIPDDVTVLFLYNPFHGEIFDAAIASLLRSADRKPRRIRIIYSNPVEHDRLMATGRVRMTKSWQSGAWIGRPNEEPVHSYDVIPAAG
jgi:SAM-dependent methyltransferase